MRRVAIPIAIVSWSILSSKNVSAQCESIEWHLSDRLRARFARGIAGVVADVAAAGSVSPG